MKDIAIEYLGGSGFLVSLGDTGLLFDASETGPDKRSLPGKETLAAFEKLYGFVSHHPFLPDDLRSVRRKGDVHSGL